MESYKCKKLSLPLLGIGTWSGLWGRRERPVLNATAFGQSIKLLQTAVALNLNHIDTAEMYGNGYAEEVIGLATAHINRQRLFVTSKVKGNRLTRRDVISAAKESLSRLKMDYLDLYLVHWFESKDALAEIIAALDDLVDQGLVAHIGVSNFSVPQIMVAQKLTRHEIAANQIEYNLLRMNFGKTPHIHSDMLPFCEENHVLVIAYNPLAGGILAKSESLPILPILATKYNRTCAQISIRWIVQHKNLVTIPSTSRLDHLLEIREVLDFELEPSDHELLTQQALHAEADRFHKTRQ